MNLKLNPLVKKSISLKAHKHSSSDEDLDDEFEELSIQFRKFYKRKVENLGRNLLLLRDRCQNLEEMSLPKKISNAMNPKDMDMWQPIVLTKENSKKMAFAATWDDNSMIQKNNHLKVKMNLHELLRLSSLSLISKMMEFLQVMKKKKSMMKTFKRLITYFTLKV